jgi:hypothetical protein
LAALGEFTLDSTPLFVISLEEDICGDFGCAVSILAIFDLGVSELVKTCLGVSALGLFRPGVPDLATSLVNLGLFGVALLDLGFPLTPD